MDQDLAVLLEHWHDGSLDGPARAALASRLRADPRRGEYLAAELRLTGQFIAALRQPSAALWQRVDDALALASGTRLADRVLKRLSGPHPPSRGMARWRQALQNRWVWTASAAALVLLGVLALHLQPAPAQPGSGGVTVAMLDERGGQPPSRGLSAALPLACDNDHHAELAFADGTHVDVGAGSSVVFASQDRHGARLDLTSGSLQVEVAKQAPDAHFVVQTREAILTAIGTRFTALRFPWGTRLEVTEGRVLAHQLADGAEIEVSAGMRVDVHKRQGGMLLISPLTRSLAEGAEVREPVADAIVVAGRYAHENRGGCVSHILTSLDAPSDERREFFLRFDLSGMRRPVTAAHLLLHLNHLNHPGMTLEVAQVADASWKEMAITWATRPEGGAPIADWHPGPDDDPIDLTAAVNAAGDQISLRIRAAAGTPPHAVVGFNTREAIAHKRPHLVLEHDHPAP